MSWDRAMVLEALVFPSDQESNAHCSKVISMLVSIMVTLYSPSVRTMDVPVSIWKVSVELETSTVNPLRGWE